MSYSIFISYRREDSRTAVTSLYDSLKKKFGPDKVFADTASIQPGDNWPDRLKKTLEEAKIVLVIIGNNWLCAEKDDPGKLRICNEKDWVRNEIETAQKLNKKIVPVSIDGAEIKDHPDLPEFVKKVRNLNYKKINLQAGESEGVSALIKFLDDTLNNLASPDELKQRLEGILVEKYKIGENIGVGHRAKVYVGRDTGLEREVAIRVVLNTDFNKEFINTLKVAAKINDHVPNSISILGAYIDRNPLHVIMTFMKKGSLRNMITEREGIPLPNKQIQDILLDIGDALVKTHSIPLAHCNVKPSNIILNDQFEAYLNPLSRIPDPKAAALIDKLSEMSVSPDNLLYREELCYVPPEKFNRYPGADIEKEMEKIDQYMLGLLGYELLTGSIPDTLTGIKELKKSKIDAFKKLPILSETVSGCPYKLSRVIHKMTEIDPAKRYDTMEEAINEIRKVSFDDVEIAKDSYARCMSSGDSGISFFRTFYNLLVAKLPEKEAKKLMKKKIGETESHKQYGILREAIFILLLFGKNKEMGDTEPNILSRIAEMHNNKNYKVSPNSYRIFLEALTDTICGAPPAIPEPFDKQCKVSQHEKDIIQKAWVNALQPGINYMISKH